jgi:hypothetical protein
MRALYLCVCVIVFTHMHAYTCHAYTCNYFACICVCTIFRKGAAKERVYEALSY